MSRRRPSAEMREALTAARWTIIQAANVHKMRSRARRWRWQWWMPPVPLFGMRQIQQAVFWCRRNRLVDDETLAAAGFRPAAGRSDRVQAKKAA